VSAEAPPTKAKRAPAKRRPAAIEQKAHAEAALIRWTPEEVVEQRLLPYRSVRVLKDKCYRREVYHHNDGGRITFSPESIRLELERTLVAPLAA